MIRRQKVSFDNGRGQQLAASLELPEKPGAFALFAHCFTCSKDIAAATRISRGLCQKGIAVLRFDFTGLGNSEGDFANTHFSSNVEDLVAAAQHLRRTFEAPQILVGHSLGGAAVLAAAERIPECRAVATIGAPSDPGHVKHLFRSSLEEIERTGEARVSLAGRTFQIRREFIQDLERQRLESRLKDLRRALLIFHSPVDKTVGIDNAAEIFQAARHPKSFVSLDKADHLLGRRQDSEYVALVLSAWASRYVDTRAPEDPSRPEGSVLVEEDGAKFTQKIHARRHTISADEPLSVGGQDRGMSPYELLLAGLGACTSMTLRMYADHKKLPVTKVSVSLSHEKVHAQDAAECGVKVGKIDRISREIGIEGNLTPAQRERMMQIADRCPVHRSLESRNVIESSLAEE